jgi:hypothetical protein
MVAPSGTSGTSGTSEKNRPSRLDRAKSRIVRSYRRRPKEGSLPQAISVLLGVVFALIGALAFLVTGFDGFVGHNPVDRLFGLAVNPLQNVLHLAVGVLGLAMSGRRVWARCYGWLLVAGMGALFWFGLIAVERPDLNLLNLNWVGNWLHLGAALAGLAAAVSPAYRGFRRGLPR